MRSLRGIVKFAILFFMGIALVLVVTGCAWFNQQQPLASVASLPNPNLPDWIEQISPTEQVETLAQVRVRFKEALIPVESLESPDRQSMLDKFEIVPSLPGRFRFLTPRMVGFQADRAIPKATRVRVTLKAGLADLKNHRLAQDLAWTFNTEPIKLTDLPGAQYNPGSSESPLTLNPTLTFTSNVELNLESLQQHVQLTRDGKQANVPLKVALKEEKTPPQLEDRPPEEKFDPATRNWAYTLTPQETLEKATGYRLEVTPGLRSAHGNLPTQSAISTRVITYAPLGLKGISHAKYGRFVEGDATVEFNNGLVAESAIANIAIDPKPKAELKLLQSYDGNNDVNLNPYALEPSTTYTITIGADLKDKFGQTLGKPVTIKYATGDVAPQIWAPSGLNIFPSGKNLQLNIATVNLPKSSYQAAYRVVQPVDLVSKDSASDLLPAPDSWASFAIKSEKNKSLETAVPLPEKLGGTTGMLAYGVRASTNKPQPDDYYGLVQLTNLGVFAQWFPESGLVRANHLDDGTAVENATVEIYRSKLDAPNSSTSGGSPCAIARTDKMGTAILNREELSQCVSAGGAGFTDPPELLVVAREGKDWAFTRTLNYSGAYSYGIDAGWNYGKPESRGTIFSDRQLYQPGEKAYFTGTAYYLQNGLLKQDKNVAYRVTLSDPSGTKTDLGTKTTNEFGTFSLELPLAANQPLGFYSIRAKSNADVEISGEFRVAEFKPPNFKVDLSLDKEYAFIDQKVTAKAQSNYLFGPPVDSSKAIYYVTRQKTEFKPKGWEQFSFGRQWFWPEEAPTVDSEVLQANEVLDANGQNSKAIAVTNDLPYPMTYRVDVEVSDVSNLSVSNSKTFTAFPSDRLIGLQNNFVADAGKPFSVQVIVTDPTGKPLEGQQIRVELQQMKYSSVTQVIEGSEVERSQVEYKTVVQAEVRSGSSAQTVSLVPSDSGSYRIRANFTDAQNDLTAADSQIWATGGSPVYWGSRYRNNRLEVKLDKSSYKPGETATVLIQSPYPEAELYFAVVRHKTLYRTIAKVQGAAPQIQFQVTPDMVPNAAVEAVLVRQGQPLGQIDTSSIDKLTRIGFAPFKTNLDDRYLKAQVIPTQSSLAPGGEQTVYLQLQDDRGSPARGQFTVMVVNEAVLQLSGYRPPDLVGIAYAEQPISTRFSDNRPDVVLQPLASPLEKGWGYGGGLSAGTDGTRIRRDFRAIAYYNGSVVTDTNGRASVAFKLPDDLTTWRVMVVATNGDLRFGNGEATFMTTKPLLSNPLLPQFARQGDRLEVGLTVTNTTGQTGTLAIDGELTGSLTFNENNQPKKAITSQTQAGSGIHAYRFPMVAEKVGTAQVQFTTRLNDAADAFSVPLDIKPLEITEQVVETGRTTSSVKIPLQVDSNVVPDTGGLEVSLASTLIPEIIAPARQIFDEDNLPFLEPAASQLAIAASLSSISKQYGQAFSNFNLTQKANEALERLNKLQQPDGGFASWLGSKQSDPFVTPYAAQSLARAAAAGITVDTVALDRLRAYLQKILADPGQYDFCKQEPCKSQIRLEALMALAELGDRRNEFLSDIYAQRGELSLANQIKLARYLFQFPDWQKEAKAMTDKLQEVVYETGRTATVNLPRGWGWFGSLTATQAQALRLFSTQNSQPDTIDRLLQGLLSLRRNGTWQSTYDNAEALTALVEYGKTQEAPPSFATTVQLAGRNLGSAKFEGYRQPNLDLNVPIAELPRGRNDLLLDKSGQGNLHYLVAYRYRLQGNPPGRFNGLGIAREIRPANQDRVIQRSGLQSSNEPLAVNSGGVFDIGLEITTDHPVDRLVITDPLPAGFEAIDASFQTSTKYFQALRDSWQINYQTIHRDRVVAFGDRLEAGVYSMHYLVRAVTPGTFLWPGAEVRLQYAPEEFGRTASTSLKVQ